MASFASKTFAHGNYAAFRPTYPPTLYNAVLSYHQPPSKIALDLGTGHGIVARSLASHFDKVLASDPSSGMIKQARDLTASISDITNVEFYESSAEDCFFVSAPASVDLVTAAEAAHWFDHSRLWPEMRRIVRPGGTLAFWCYCDHTIVSYPKATEILRHYACSMDEHLLGSYWPQPGRSILRDHMRGIVPPVEDWTDIQRIEYSPGVEGPRSGQGTPLLAKRMTLGAMAEYVRTWSTYYHWQKRWPERVKRCENDDDSKGDVVDDMMDEIFQEEPDLRLRANNTSWEQIEIDVEWESAIILARRRRAKDID